MYYEKAKGLLMQLKVENKLFIVQSIKYALIPVVHMLIK